MDQSLPKVFQPGAIGKLEIKNRIVLPPMLMGYGSEVNRGVSGDSIL